MRIKIAILAILFILLTPMAAMAYPHVDHHPCVCTMQAGNYPWHCDCERPHYHIVCTMQVGNYPSPCDWMRR